MDKNAKQNKSKQFFTEKQLLLQIFVNVAEIRK